MGVRESVRGGEAQGGGLDVGGKKRRDSVADPQRPLRGTVRGPRRVKIRARAAAGSGKRSEFTVQVRLDGKPLLTRTWHAGVNPAVRRCDGKPEPVTSLRKTVVAIPAGKHTLQLTGGVAGGGRVLVRVLRESRRPGPDHVAFAPEEYGRVTYLQFDSGRRTTYYTFDADHPLACRLHGPVDLEVWTRLDFDHTLNGTQAYVVEALLDGRPLRTFHYQTRKLDAAVYTDRPDVLPGQRKSLHLAIPPGEHRLELRCQSPDNCSIAARLRLPARELHR